MITVLAGKNEHAIKAALDELNQKTQKELGDFGIERIDASETDMDDILQAVQSVPFLVSKKLVVLTGMQHNKQLLERVDELLERTAEMVDVVIVGAGLDKRSVAWKTLKKSADVTEFPELKPFELPKWVVGSAKSLGVKVTQPDASYLIDRVGTNQLILMRELEKMAVVAATIDRTVIDRLTEQSPQSSIFDMLEAAFSGKKIRAIELYRQQRQQRVEPQYIIAMLTWQLQALSLAVFAQPMTEQTLVAAGQSPYSARKSLGLARTLSKQKVKQHVHDLVAVDAAIKTSAEPDAALELYILKL